MTLKQTQEEELRKLCMADREKFLEAIRAAKAKDYMEGL